MITNFVNLMLNSDHKLRSQIGTMGMISTNQTRYDRDTQSDQTPTFAMFLDLSTDRSALLSMMTAEAEEGSRR